MAGRSRRSARARRAAQPLLAFLPAVPVRPRRRKKAAVIGLPLVPLPRKPAKATRPATKGRTAGRWSRSTYTGPAGSRSYDVYLPAGHRRTTRLPLVLLLHGCDQSSEQFVAATRFTALADRHGVVIDAPRQTRGHQPGGCWRWYEAGHQARGAGEPAIMAGIVAQLLAETTRWRIDRSRVYAAGISAGGAMSLILAATYPDVFAAVGVHSAPAYRSASAGRNAFNAMNGRGTPTPPLPGAQMAPLILFQGTA